MSGRMEPTNWLLESICSHALAARTDVKVNVPARFFLREIQNNESTVLYLEMGSDIRDTSELSPIFSNTMSAERSPRSSCRGCQAGCRYRKRHQRRPAPGLVLWKTNVAWQKWQTSQRRTDWISPTGCRRLHSKSKVCRRSKRVQSQDARTCRENQRRRIANGHGL